MRLPFLLECPTWFTERQCWGPFLRAREKPRGARVPFLLFFAIPVDILPAGVHFAPRDSCMAKKRMVKYRAKPLASNRLLGDLQVSLAARPVSS
jgi:hypothetical protein